MIEEDRRTFKLTFEDQRRIINKEITLLDLVVEKQEEIERLKNIIEEIREYVKHKIVECYDEGSTIGEFYKICDIDSKIEELLNKGDDKE